MLNKYYDILEISEEDKKLNKEDLQNIAKKKYRLLSKKFHPDLNPGDTKAEEKFKEISEAYAIVTGKQQPPRQDIPQGQQFRQRQQHFTRKGRTIELEVYISLEEAYNGGQHKVTFDTTDSCKPCNGVGGHNPKTCNQCGGSGMLSNGPFVFMCNNCQGNGNLFVNVCNNCHGTGGVRTKRTLDINITKGTTDRTLAMARGMGNFTKGGTNGDVLFIIRIQTHPIFELDGLQLKRKVDIPMLDLISGRILEFDTLDGKVKITVPKLCEPTKTFRLRGKGFIDGGYNIAGDLYVTLNPTLPKEISPEEESIINKLKTSSNFSSV